MSSPTPQLHLVQMPLKALGGRIFETTFEESTEFEERWWIKMVRSPERATYFSALIGDIEVARVELLEKRELNPDFSNVPRSADGFLEFAFFEVAATHRRQQIGTAVVEMIVTRFDRSFAAYSEGADRFWGSLRWPRYEHGTEPTHFRPLYVLER